MSMKAMDDIMDKVCDELEDAAEKLSRDGKISMSDLEKLGELIDIKKNLLKIEMLEDGGYSQAGDWEARGRFGDRPYDEGGNSYARGQRRDSRGRYSREGHGGRDMMRDGRGRYSRDGGDDIMEHVDMMMDVAKTPEERELITRFKRQLKEVR